MTRLYFLAISAVLAGCASPGIGVTRYYEGPTYTQDQVPWLEQLILPACPVDTMNYPAGTQCGLITDTLFSPEGKAAFVQSSCQGKDNSECHQKLFKSAYAKMQLRYSAADLTKVRLQCDADPIKCESPRNTELTFLQAHDDAIFAALHSYNRQWLQEHQRRPASHCTINPNGSGGFYTDCD